ncbi:MAG: class I SAM-dependent RNA methyltransferase [Chlorobi bacterium]|nr:class I SAM-dependent RNA methyltransferase [Chlorobiota bacterium]
MDSYRYIVTCPKGLLPYAQAEIESLGYQPIGRGPAAIEIVGDSRTMYRLNLWLRCAHRVLLKLWEGTAATAADLYHWAVRLPWEEHILPTSVLTVSASVRNVTIRNSLYACQKLKDAIADRLRNRLGKRPDSNGRTRQAVVFLYWRENDVAVYFDTSGVPLSKRGYRRMTAAAPLSEALAAAVLAASGWTGDVPLINPMSGSGTIAIEAAMIARRIPPAWLRTSFSFQHWRGYRPDLWHDEIGRAEQGIVERQLTVIACDTSPEAYRAARVNAHAAGVGGNIRFLHCDYREMPLPPPPATIIVNPPYGIRIGEQHEVAVLYKQLGDWLKRECSGMRCFVLTTPSCAKHVGLHAERRSPFFNADIECRLIEYELYRGSRRTSPDVGT